MQKLRSQSRLVICKPASLPILILLALICFLNVSLVCDAAIIEVPENYSSIQSAINAASDGDEIIVSPATYYENINFNGKNIILRSTDPTSPTIVASTIIDASTSGSVVTFSGTELTTCVLSGFAIINGKAFYGDGGGIHGNGTLATIQNNIISDNSAHSNRSGGGIWNCDGIIQNNTISHNSAGYGGGLSDCNGIIQNNIISGNLVGGYYGNGGGVSDCHGTIQNNIISNNYSSSGGGFYECDGTIQNNTISDNTAYSVGGGLYRCQGTIQNNTILGNSAGVYGGGLYMCRRFIINCIIWGNSAPTGSQVYECSAPFYSCIQDWAGDRRGNISADPEFIDPTNGNYHLRPDSPCIDTGNTYYLLGDYLVDIDGECRIAGSSVDMGSDEYGSSPDSDGDLLADINESNKGTNTNDADSDGDGLMDGVEVLRGTDPNIADMPPGITIPADYSSIQQALFMAFPGEVIIVEPGSYHENLHFLGKNLALQSTNPLEEGIVSTTIIDGDRLFSVIFFEGRENETAVVKGLTIRNGCAYDGAGICGNGTLAKIEYNKILDNSTTATYGSGAGLFACNGTIQNNVISGNSAGSGGGGLAYCDGPIQHNTISANSAERYGGGLFDCAGIMENNTISRNQAKGDGSRGGGLCFCDGTIRGNIISENSAFWGGGLYKCDGPIQRNIISDNRGRDRGGGLNQCDGQIQNNIISYNSATGDYAFGGGLFSCNGAIVNNTIFGNWTSGNYASEGGGLYSCYGTIRNCIIWQNAALSGAQLYACSTPSYSCVQDWIGGGTGNTYFDPALVDPAAGDFHLLPVSPCIDAGGSISDLTQDFESDPRPYDALSWETRGDGSDFDIGADEFIGIAPIDYPPEQPTNISPPNGATGVSLAPTLRSSPFSDTYPGEPHIASQWQLDDNGDFSSPIFDSGLDKENKSSITLAPTRLTTLTRYYWRIRHMDNRGTWSEWSNATDFITKPPGLFIVPDDYVSIQEAINAVIDGDEIIVSPGIYYENINFMGRNIILRSTDPTNPTVVARTIINGSWAGSVVTFSGTENETCVLSGFTITGGYTLNGGGIYGNGTRATIENNIISHNSAFGSEVANGGGLYDCDGIIRNNVISENRADVRYGYSTWWPYAYSWEEYVYHDGGNGGGLYDCDGAILNNIIFNNTANDGGGLYGCDGTIQNNTIVGNRANGHWSYQYCYRIAPFQYRCDNPVCHSTGAGGGLARSSPGTIIRNCIFWENSASYINDELSYDQPAFYCCIQGWTSGRNGIISSDPEFVDSENGDFHLLPISPCIDAGGIVNLAQDFEGDPRPWDGTSEPRGDGSDFDIGADEFFVFTPLLYEYNSSEEGWTTGTAAIFSEPQCVFEPGRLKLISQTNTNTFGYWSSPENAIPVTKGYLYRAQQWRRRSISNS